MCNGVVLFPFENNLLGLTSLLWTEKELKARCLEIYQYRVLLTENYRNDNSLNDCKKSELISHFSADHTEKLKTFPPWNNIFFWLMIYEQGSLYVGAT
jgi:hypothetical protein